MEVGSYELARSIVAYLIALGFAVTFLLTACFGGGLGAALTRSILVAISIRVIGPPLVRPVIGAVLDAIARDTQQARDAAEPAGDEPA